MTIDLSKHVLHSLINFNVLFRMAYELLSLYNIMNKIVFPIVVSIHDAIIVSFENQNRTIRSKKLKSVSSKESWFFSVHFSFSIYFPAHSHCNVTSNRSNSFLRYSIVTIQHRAYQFICRAPNQVYETRF